MAFVNIEEITCDGGEHALGVGMAEFIMLTTHIENGTDEVVFGGAGVDATAGAGLVGGVPVMFPPRQNPARLGVANPVLYNLANIKYWGTTGVRFKGFYEDGQ